jgi:hypothetical protein
MSAAVCAMMPRVVPNPSSCTWPGVIEAADSPMPPVAMNSSSTAITTMLLITGVHIGAAKWPRALSTAPASELIP